MTALLRVMVWFQAVMVPSSVAIRNVLAACLVAFEMTNCLVSLNTSPEGAPGPPPGAGMPGGPMGPPRTNWTETVIPVGNGAEGFDVSPDGKEIWVANAQDGTISVVEVASKKVVQTLAADVLGANRLKFTPDGRLVLISSLRAPDLVVIDAATRKEVRHVKIGRGAAGILMQPDGLRAFVACSPDDYVAVIDLKSLEMTGKIAAGKQPDGLAWAVRK